MRKLLLPIAVFAICATAWSQTYTVETVPNTKLINNSYVSDPAGILDPYTVSEINALLDSLESKTTAQVAVVMLPSIGDADRFDFAQRLFKLWGIGQEGKDNGLLILFILDQRNVRFHTGYGLEGVLPDATCKRIQLDYMIPHFRTGDYNSGMRAGVSEVYSKLTSRSAIDEIFDGGPAPEIRNYYLLVAFLWVIGAVIALLVAWGYKKFQQPSSNLRIRLSIWNWLILYAVIPLAYFIIAYQANIAPLHFAIGFYGGLILLFIERFQRVRHLAAPLIEKNKYQEVYSFYIRQRTYWTVASVFFPLPVWLLYRSLMRKAYHYRNRPRHCGVCGDVAEKLSEQAEDEFLSAGQQAEEKFGTVDYDVWKCKSCGAVELLNYPDEKAKYTRCPECDYVTYKRIGQRTVESATYSHDGRGEDEYNCLHCGFVKIFPFVIPMLVASSSSSSDSSSSSSDSGGSWGGGDSGGGGADSSW